MDVLVQVSIISGLFGVIMVTLLHFSWTYKLKMTVQAEEIQRQRAIDLKKYDVKMAKIKSPMRTKRLPKGYRNQLSDLLDLLGDEQIQGIVQSLSGHQEDYSDNKILNTLLPLAQGFLNAQQEKQQELPAFKGQTD